ncbi:MAG: hypothetical protein U0132_15975 [Gemmatimonadaceae bacterium]
MIAAGPSALKGQHASASRAGVRPPESAIGLRVSGAARFTGQPAAVPVVPAWHRGLQLAGGVVGAWAGGIISYKVAEDLANDRRVKGDEGYSPAGNWAWVASSLVGAALGVAGTGRGLTDHGSVKWALAGAAAPSLLLLTVVDDPYLPIYGFVFAAPLQAVGAMLGYSHHL